MRIIKAEDAQARSAEVLRIVGDGKTVADTVRGGPVAQSIPVQEPTASAAEAIKDWRCYRREQNQTLGDDVTIRGLIEEGRDRRTEHLTRIGYDEDNQGE